MAAVMNNAEVKGRAEGGAASNVAIAGDPDHAEIIEDKRTTSDNRIVVEKYAKGRMLGKGGFAKCFLAVCLQTNKEYALKIVAKSSLLKPKSRMKLQSEIKIHRSLKNDYIVRFDRFFEDHVNAYMKLELCANNSMSELLKKRKRLTEPEARYYLQQLVSGLEYLHANLIIHRDLKLGNLFIDGNMTIKIGDFGLATRLAFPSERKRTVCGTPNYIAPEILEGKDGHSFEVDNWSIGVIIYTMIVGRPPYECRDVKSTYKKILANSYSYPDLIPVSDGAKQIIGSILQTRPEKRLSLSGIKEHSFNTTNYTPTWLPLTAMVISPENCLVPIPAAPSKLSRDDTPAINDENDRLALNRVAGDKPAWNNAGPSAADHVKVPTKVIAEVNTNRSFKLRAATAENTSSEKVSSGRVLRSASAIHPRPEAQPVTSSRYAAAASGTRSKQQTESKSTGQKFTIFSDNDNLTAEAGTAPSQGQKWAWGQNMPKKESSTNPPPLPYEKDKKQMTSNWANENATAVDEKPWKAAGPVPDLKSKRDQSIPSKIIKSPTEECDFEEVGLDKLEWDMDRMSLKNKGNRDSLTGLAELGINNMNDSNPRRDSSESQRARTRSASYATPLASAPKVQRPLRTLEAIHDTLSLGVVVNDAAAAAPSIPGIEIRASSDVWVVRYMDYTSKYGLGFLLNNGCAGVYFNDSTKIILSADGAVFQYFERRHRNSATIASEGDHLKTTYLLSSHPPELVKKVTLLRHFRDYLLDHKTTETPAVPEGKGNLVPANPVVLPVPALGSTAWSLEARGADLDAWKDMPYLKKWVRTRHAVLLRLSNRSVQVSFFDMSELLLSAEANIVTYLDRDGQRTHHILRDVMESGRADIVKRLRYTKDIMYRLINLQN